MEGYYTQLEKRIQQLEHSAGVTPPQPQVDILISLCLCAFINPLSGCVNDPVVLLYCCIEGERWASVTQIEYLLEGSKFHYGASAALNGS